MDENEIIQEQEKVEEPVSIKEEAAEIKEQAKKTIQKIKATAKEEDPKLSSAVTLRSILGGDFLTLTEKCRESHVLDALKNNKDSLLHIADQPPYKIYIDE